MVGQDGRRQPKLVSLCADEHRCTARVGGELGPSGIRVICLRRSPKRWPHHTPARSSAASPSEPAPPAEGMLAERARTGTVLKRLPTLDEVANVAAFVASDRASAMTGAIANLTCHHPGRGAASDRDRSAAVQQTARGKRQHFSRQRSSCSSPTTTSADRRHGYQDRTRSSGGTQSRHWCARLAGRGLAFLAAFRASWPGGWLRPACALVGQGR